MKKKKRFTKVELTPNIMLLVKILSLILVGIIILTKNTRENVQEEIPEIILFPVQMKFQPFAVTTKTENLERSLSEPGFACTWGVEENIETLFSRDLMSKEFWNYNYTLEDVYLLGDLMYIEEQQYTEDENGELVLKACGSVVLHRMAEKQGFFPNTVKAVIYEGKGTSKQQYSSTTLQKIGNIDTPEIVYQWAEDILRDGPIGPSNLVFQDSQIHGEVWMHYGNQYFCLSSKIN